MLVMKSWFYVEPLTVGGFFLTFPVTLVSGCEVLIRGYPLVAQCFHMERAQTLIKLLTWLPALLNYLWLWKTGFQSLMVGGKLALFSTLPSRGVPRVLGSARYRVGAAFCWSCSRYVQPKCWRGAAVLHGGSCAFGPLGPCDGAVGLGHVVLLAAGCVRSLHV